MNPTATSMPATDPLHFYEHALEVVEYQIQELLINRLYSPSAESPATLKDLDLATRLLKSGLEIHRKIKNLRAPNKPIEAKPTEPKSKSTESAPPTEPVPISEPIPKSEPVPKSESAAPAASAPTTPSTSSTSSTTKTPSQPSLTSPSSLTSLPATQSTQSTSSTPSTASHLRFRITDSAAQRFLKERQHQLAAKSAVHRSHASKSKCNATLSP